MTESASGLRSNCDRHRHLSMAMRKSPLVAAAASKVLHEGVASDDHAGGPVRLQSAHWAKPGLEPAVVVLDPVVGVLGGVALLRDVHVDDVVDLDPVLSEDLFEVPI